MLTKTYSPKTVPRNHQREALVRLEKRPSTPSSEDVMAWLMEMGTGKSKVILDEFGEREASSDLKDLLIIAPAGSYRNWDQDKSDIQLSQIKTHLSDDLQNRLLSCAWVSGAGSTFKKKLTSFLDNRNRPRILVVNVEALSTVEAARNACKQFLGSGNQAMMVIDESTSIKGRNTQRTRSVLNLANSARVRRILTGLVTPRSPMDLYTQFEFLDWRILGHRSWFSFRARYAILKSMSLPQPGGGFREFKVEVGYRNLDELQSLIDPYSYRVLKEDCLDLPPKTYQFREVDMNSQQKRLYTELRENATTELAASGTFVTATMVTTRNLRLHQLLCGHIVDELGNEHEVPSHRMDTLLEILAEHNGKVIIWVPYQFTLKKIISVLKKEYGPDSVAAFWGGNQGERGDEERRWLNDNKCRFMVATPAAGGKGNTWVVANLVIYFSNADDLELRLQSEDRAHRDGLKHSVTYIDLIARGTREENIIGNLRRKIDMATTISGDNWKDWLI